MKKNIFLASYPKSGNTWLRCIVTNLLNPNNDEALFINGQAYQATQNYKKAEFFYNQIFSNSFYFFEAQRKLAFNYSKQLDFNKVEIKIKNTIKALNNHPELLKILADFYRTNKNYDFAIKYYTKLSLTENENLWDIYYLRGICYERLGKWEYILKKVE